MRRFKATPGPPEAWSRRWRSQLQTGERCHTPGMRETEETTAAASGAGALTRPEFWEQEYHWADAVPPCRPDPALAVDRRMVATLEELAPARPGERVLEIGCAPAKWLAFYGERYGAHVDGIEYSAKGAEISEANLRHLGLEGHAWHADFFEWQPRPYDLVLSLGFIEHFDDLESVFARHLKFVAPGGRLVLGLPNYRGVVGLTQRLAEPGHLAIHNVEAMRPALWRRLAAEHGIEIEAVRYFGGFDPCIIQLGDHPLLSPRRIIPGLVTLFGHTAGRLPGFDRLDHPWVSSGLLLVMRRAGG